MNQSTIDNFMSGLEQYRKHEPTHPETEEEKAGIVEIIKNARKDNGNGIVSTRKLSEEIEREFGYKISRTTIGQWEKL